MDVTKGLGKTHGVLVELLESYRHPYSKESLLQDSVADVLRAAGIEFSREHILSGRDRVDFFVKGVAIECKIDGGHSAVLSQCLRYAEHDAVKSVILVTCRARHRSNMQDIPTLNNKPFSLVWVASL